MLVFFENLIPKEREPLAVVFHANYVDPIGNNANLFVLQKEDIFMYERFFGYVNIQLVGTGRALLIIKVLKSF